MVKKKLTKYKVQIGHLKFEKRLKTAEVDARAAERFRGSLYRL